VLSLMLVAVCLLQVPHAPQPHVVKIVIRVTGIIGIMIHIAIRSMAGEVIEVELEPERQVHHIKQHVMSEWHLPGECQKLVHGARLLLDSERVMLLCTDKNQYVELTLVISVDVYVRDLNSRISLMRRTALDILGELRSRGGSAAVNAVTTCLEDEDWCVRCAAVRALIKLSKKGDAHTLAALSARLEDANSVVKRVVLEGLAQLADKIEQIPIRVLRSCLEDEKWQVRIAAIEAFAQLEDKGDAQTITALKARLEDDKLQVRTAAEGVINQLTQKGDQNIIIALPTCLEDHNGEVCKKAETAFFHVASID